MSAVVTRHIWIARHAERLDFIDKAWHDKSMPKGDPYDSPLSPNGLCQAQDLADRLAQRPCVRSHWMMGCSQWCRHCE